MNSFSLQNRLGKVKKLLWLNFQLFTIKLPEEFWIDRSVLECEVARNASLRMQPAE